MSGLQDENSFSAGGGTEGGEKKKQVAQVSRPGPAALLKRQSEGPAPRLPF
jgi:hypothetical protein